MQSPTPASGSALVLVSGSGRSGTSSVAGSLKRLGLHIPQPEVEASETNPRGFYEPRWVIDYHKTRLKQLALHNIDSRPAAVDLVAELVATGEPGTTLREWLSGEVGPPQILVKDPHAFWFAEVWESVCADLGVDLRWLTALRHPAEVVGSRDLAYLQSQPDELRLVKETSNVAGWVHAALLTERAGREHQRSFIRYTDLLEDWRPALARVAEQLSLDYDADLGSSDHHPVDDFLEPSMRKSHLTWDDVRVPGWLQALAEEIWTIHGHLVEHPQDPGSTGRLDELHEEYVGRYAEAMALTFDHAKGQAALAAREARDAQRDQTKQLREQLKQTRSRLQAQQDRPVQQDQTPTGLLQRLRRR